MLGCFLCLFVLNYEWSTRRGIEVGTIGSVGVYDTSLSTFAAHYSAMEFAMFTETGEFIVLLYRMYDYIVGFFFM